MATVAPEIQEISKLQERWADRLCRKGAEAELRPLEMGPARWEWVIPSFAALCLGVLGVCNALKRPLWNDEVIAWVPIHDPSITHMIRAVMNGADGAPVLYHLIARAWASVMPGREFSVRSLTIAFFCATVFVLWRTLRSYTGWRASAIAVCGVFACYASVLSLIQDGRNYGLFTFSAAVFFHVALRLTQCDRLSPGLLTAAFLSTVLLVYSHLYGIVYAACGLGALVLYDMRMRRRRWRIYLAVATGMATLAAWIPVMRRVAAVAQPKTWMPALKFADLREVYQHLFRPSDTIFALFVVCLVIVAIGWVKTRRQRGKQISPLPIFGAVLVLPPAIVILYSMVRPPVYVPRYVLPSVLGSAFLLAYLYDRATSPRCELLRWLRTDAAQTIATFLVIFVGFVWPLENASFGFRSDRVPSAAEIIEKYLPDGVPIVAESHYDLVDLKTYWKHPENVFYVSDFEVASDRRNLPDQLFLWNERRLWAQNGYWTESIQDTDLFLRAHDRFVVIHRRPLRWLEMRVLHNPDFDVKLYAEHNFTYFYMVERRNAGAQATSLTRPETGNAR